MKVRVRFPPSPTGHWHLGGARTALFNWLFARANRGDFILRIEDTDRERSHRKYEEEIIEAMRWLGLDWDEGPDKGGPYAPYRQSERAHIYKEYLEKLLEKGSVYYCYCTKEELEAQKQAQLAEGLPPKYGGHCRTIKKPPQGKTPEVIRFKVPEVKVEFPDIIRGKVKFDAGLFGDIAIAKSLDAPLYNFAAVVDDYVMQISHVIRGEEHLSNTPKQILIQKALGFEEPVYAHLPLILAPDHSKLSKRSTEVSVLSYREEGYLPEAMVNFLALLGWHPKEDREILSLQELTELFELKRVQKAGAVFNQEKLDWLNQQYLKKLSVEDIAERLKPSLEEKGIQAKKEVLHKIIAVERERMKTLGDFLELTKFFFQLPEYDVALLTWKTDSKEATKNVLERISSALEKVPENRFSKTSIALALDVLINEYGKGTVLWPLRVALSGQTASPDPLEIGEILGREESLRRIEIARGKMK